MSWFIPILLLLGPFEPVQAPGGSCAEACYQHKSEAYQRCRGIPPANRDQRQACFQQADGALKRCLGRCGR